MIVTQIKPIVRIKMDVNVFFLFRFFGIQEEIFLHNEEQF